MFFYKFQQEILEIMSRGDNIRGQGIDATGKEYF
jgi:hypothetical protein